MDVRSRRKREGTTETETPPRWWLLAADRPRLLRLSIKRQGRGCMEMRFRSKDEPQSPRIVPLGAGCESQPGVLQTSNLAAQQRIGGCWWGRSTNASAPKKLCNRSRSCDRTHNKGCPRLLSPPPRHDGRWIGGSVHRRPQEEASKSLAVVPLLLGHPDDPDRLTTDPSNPIHPSTITTGVGARVDRKGPGSSLR